MYRVGWKSCLWWSIRVISGLQNIPKTLTKPFVHQSFHGLPGLSNGNLGLRGKEKKKEAKTRKVQLMKPHGRNVRLHHCLFLCTKERYSKETGGGGGGGGGHAYSSSRCTSSFLFHLMGTNAQNFQVERKEQQVPGGGAYMPASKQIKKKVRLVPNNLKNRNFNWQRTTTRKQMLLGPPKNFYLILPGSHGKKLSEKTKWVNHEKPPDICSRQNTSLHW